LPITMIRYFEWLQPSRQYPLFIVFTQSTNFVCFICRCFKLHIVPLYYILERGAVSLPTAPKPSNLVIVTQVLFVAKLIFIVKIISVEATGVLGKCSHAVNPSLLLQ
jgi:hypothetical protein